jgi:hypothetical protein
MLRRLLLITLLLFFSTLTYSQIVQGRQHFFNKSHKTRVVVNKKYNLISDSAYLTYEFIAGNTNAWNGDIYNQYPSIQFLSSYDNNKNFEVGIFICLPYTAFNSLNPAGADLFFSHLLVKNLYAIIDIYTFLGYHSDLITEMGYNSNIYNLYTLRLQYDISQKVSLYTGYSILNDPTTTQQSLFTECDYDLTKNIPIVLGYAGESYVSNLSLSNIYAGVGLKSILINNRICKLKLLTALNPLYIENIKTNWPISVSFSMDF